MDNRIRKPPAKKTSDIPSLVSTNTTTSTNNMATTNKAPSASLDYIGGGSKPLTKGECLTAQAKSMVAITRILEGSSEARNNLLVAKHMNSNANATSVKIFNIKQVVEMEGTTIEEEKNKVVVLLGKEVKAHDVENMGM